MTSGDQQAEQHRRNVRMALWLALASACVYVAFLALKLG
jgi:hypothetical protein